ncbi:MAG: diaminopimelate epimerase [Deltaproteobacteria bacterium]
MNRLPFFKMSGSGNDFIIVDNRRQRIPEEMLQRIIVGACRRKMSVGADGFILVEESRQVDFKWRFFNADGSRAEMCGNGARCVSRFAFLNNIAGTRMSFETDAGVIAAEVVEDRVKIKMTDPMDLKEDLTLHSENDTVSYAFINTGVPHAVIRVADLESVDVVGKGRTVRFHEAFGPAGTNVNFMCTKGNNELAIRTYERGVENETLACGTGSVAAALIATRQDNLVSPVTVTPRSGQPLRIFFQQDGLSFTDVFLEGDARVVYTGELWGEAWK